MSNQWERIPVTFHQFSFITEGKWKSNQSQCMQLADSLMWLSIDHLYWLTIQHQLVSIDRLVFWWSIFIKSIAYARSTCIRRALNKNGYGQKNEPTIVCPAEYTTKTKPKTDPKLTLNLVFKVRVRVCFFRISFRICLSGVLRWANISLAHFSSHTLCYS